MVFFITITIINDVTIEIYLFEKMSIIHFYLAVTIVFLFTTPIQRNNTNMHIYLVVEFIKFIVKNFFIFSVKSVTVGSKCNKLYLLSINVILDFENPF